MADSYVILTGSKNNAGDYLIKYRAKELFTSIRQDREIIDLNAWEKFDQDRLDEVNNSKALILMGGPALQSIMRPNIYPMVDDLNLIKVPVIMMGVGWKSISGNWKDTYQYPLNTKTIELLKKVDQSGYKSSVRDYHTLNAVNFKGCDNFLMTGCPAYYDLPSIGGEVEQPLELNKVAFSLGVSFVESKSMEKLFKENILQCKKIFSDKKFEVVFHHSLDRKDFLAVGSETSKHVESHNIFAQWLESKGIEYTDISGSAESLINYYSNVDLHIGYRVHAHIFMSSISRFSILISEDGRAKATRRVIGGIVLDGYSGFRESYLSKIMNRLVHSYDRYRANEYLMEELVININYEKRVQLDHIKNSRKSIDINFNTMKLFLQQLP